MALKKSNKINEDKVIEESLNAIYGEEKVDFSKFERSKGRLTKILFTIVVTLFVVAATLWGGFFVYSEYFTNQNTEIFLLEIEAEEELVSGSFTQIAIKYKNPTEIPIASLELDIKLPPSFHRITASPAPTNEEEMSWDVGYLNASSDGLIIIEGIWISDVPASTPIQVFASFRPSNFNADFQEIKTIYITTTESNLVGELSGAEEGRPGETLNYALTIENKGEEEIPNVKTKLTIPQGFYLESSDPKIEPGEPIEWSFESIAPGAKEEIKLVGSFAADTEGFQYFDAEIFAVEGERNLIQGKIEAFTDVVGDNLSLQLVANGSTEKISTDMGESMRVSLAIENSGENDIEDLSLELLFNEDKPLPIDWENSEINDGTKSKTGINWDNEYLGFLTSGEKRIFNLVFPINQNVTESEADVFEILVVAHIGNFEIRSKPIEIAINSEADFHADARYFTDEGAPLGSGSLPPAVGKQTNYRVNWSIQNKLHDLQNIKVQAMLPPHAEWNNQFNADLGTIKFDADTRTVNWEIVEIPKDITKLDAMFSISITPDTEDVGKFVKLISGSTMTVTDKVTNATIIESTESITTELPSDEFASGKGVVVE